VSAAATAPERPTVLSVRGLTRRFGGVTAVSELDLDVPAGEVLGVIGPNGAGKSTLVGLVCGELAPSAGRIVLDGVDVTGRDAAQRARAGVGRTHQIPRPFARMSVLENLLLSSSNVPNGRSTSERRRDALAVLERTGLAEVAAKPAGGLTLLRRKRLELARAMALSPRLLMLDEIGAGLVESETHELIELIQELRDEVQAMLVIEHVMEVITACCDRAAVLDFGKLIAVGPTRQVLADPTVAAVYLGTAAAEHGTGSASAVAEEQVAAHEDRADSNLGQIVINDRTVASLVSVADAGRGAPLLDVTDLAVSYGGLRALRGIDLTVHPGETVTLLGANGAGKTTFTRAVAGALPLVSGTVRFGGQDITRMRPDRVTALGLAQCMEGRRIFGTLTVEENLVLGAGPADAAVRNDRLESVYSVFPILAERRAHSGTAMSGGQQQMLAIGRALMSAPRLLVLDEISLGLAPIAVDRLYEALEAIKASGVAMILVEQNIGRGLALAERAYVLAQGRVALSGTAAQVRDDPALAALYVGEATEG
jgi:ABC-type branched-subunit amino acid transport system ATPase component